MVFVYYYKMLSQIKVRGVLYQCDTQKQNLANDNVTLSAQKATKEARILFKDSAVKVGEL